MQHGCNVEGSRPLTARQGIDPSSVRSAGSVARNRGECGNAARRKPFDVAADGARLSVLRRNLVLPTMDCCAMGRHGSTHLGGPFPDEQVLLARRPVLRPGRPVTIVVPDAAVRPRCRRGVGPVAEEMALTKHTPIIGVLSPGDMGRSIGMVLQAHGVRKLTCLGGRSAAPGRWPPTPASRTPPRWRARPAGRYPAVRTCPGPSGRGCRRGCGRGPRHRCRLALRRLQRRVSADRTGDRTEVEDAGARFVDVGIVGPPPVVTGSTGSATRFYASGSGSAELAALGSYGLDVRVVGPDVGRPPG